MCSLPLGLCLEGEGQGRIKGLELSLKCPPPCCSLATAGEGRKEFKAKCGKINFKTQGEGRGVGVAQPGTSGGGSFTSRAASVVCLRKQNALYFEVCQQYLHPQSGQVTFRKKDLSNIRPV